MSARRTLPLYVLALDHRKWFEDQPGATSQFITAFKTAATTAAAEALEQAGYAAHAGFILDGQYGQEALAYARQRGFWTAEPIEQSAVYPLALLDEPGRWLLERPADRTVKVLVFDPDSVQLPLIFALEEACRRHGRDYLLEVVVRGGHLGDTVEYLHRQGLRPHWWKVSATPGLDKVQRIAQKSPNCRGVLLLGGGEPIESLQARWSALPGPFAGCAVGRTVFGDAFKDLQRGRPLQEAAAQVAERFLTLLKGLPSVMACSRA